MTKKKRLELLQEARDMGMAEITIDNVHYKLGKTEEQKPMLELTEEQVKALVNPMSLLDDLSEEEILYYATPYFDELQAKKETRNQQLKDKENE